MIVVIGSRALAPTRSARRVGIQYQLLMGMLIRRPWRMGMSNSALLLISFTLIARRRPFASCTIPQPLPIQAPISLAWHRRKLLLCLRIVVAATTPIPTMQRRLLLTEFI